MSWYVALLRGITPSDPRMSNTKLRAAVEGLGFEGVGSVLASGNILFQGPVAAPEALEREIQEQLNGELGIPGGAIVRTHDQLRVLWEKDPFQGLTHGRGSYLTASFLKGTSAARPLPEQLDPSARVIGYDESARAFLAVIDNSRPGRTPEYMTWLEKTYGKDVTTRTWLTVKRILAKLDAASKEARS